MLMLQQTEIIVTDPENEAVILINDQKYPSYILEYEKKCNLNVSLPSFELTTHDSYQRVLKDYMYTMFEGNTT